MVRSLLFAALVATPALVLADPPAGQIDPTFGDFAVNNGVAGLQLAGFNLGGSWSDYAYAMAEDAQGRLIVAGVATTDDGACLGLMRFTPDGQLDTDGFGSPAPQGKTKGKICHSVPEFSDGLGSDLDIAVLPDGGFFVAGVEDSPFICRFQANGDKAVGFGNGTGCISIPQIKNASVPAPALLIHDASLLIVTNHEADGIYSPVLARVSTETGAIEPFGTEPFIHLLSNDTEALAFAWDAVLTADGNIMLSGEIETDPGDVDALVARFDLQHGQPDLTFSGDGMARFKFNKTLAGFDYMKAIVQLPNGDILAAGDIEMSDRRGIAVVQLDAATGALSPAFNNGLPMTYDPCSALEDGGNIQVRDIARTAGHIVVAGRAEYGMFATRLTDSGGVDKTFGQQGLAKIDLVGANKGATGMVLQGDRIVLTGYAINGSGDSDFALLRLSGGRLFGDQFEADVP